MARFYGVIGYGSTVETVPGVWEHVVTERKYFGDVLRNTRRLTEGENLHDDLTVNNSISVLADPYAYEHFHEILYVEWSGTKWKVAEVEVVRPRLNLRLREVYNGPTPEVTPDPVGDD